MHLSFLSRIKIWPKIEQHDSKHAIGKPWHQILASLSKKVLLVKCLLEKASVSAVLSWRDKLVMRKSKEESSKRQKNWQRMELDSTIHESRQRGKTLKARGKNSRENSLLECPLGTSRQLTIPNFCQHTTIQLYLSCRPKDLITL